MIKQKSVVIKTASAALTYSEMGDIVCSSATDITITLPIPNSGLWYRVSNVGAGIVTVYYGSALTALNQTEQCLCLANASTSWFFGKGGGAMTKAEIETVLIGEISSHNHAAVYELPIGGTLGQVLAKNSVTDRDVVWGDVSGGGGLVINPNHIFVDNIARDNYFTANLAELITGIYISVGTGFQQWDGVVWLDKTAVVTGPIGANGSTGANGADGLGIPAGGTTGQILSKIDETDYNTQWVSGGIVTSVVFSGNVTASARTESAYGLKFLAMIDAIAIGIIAYIVWTAGVTFTVKLWSGTTILASGTVVGDGTTSWKTVNLDSEYPITQFAEYHISIERPSLSISKYYVTGGYVTAFLTKTVTYSGLPTSQSVSGDPYAIGIKIRL